MSVIFHGTILDVKNVCNLWEEISFIFQLHVQMSVTTYTMPWLRTFGRELYVYNTEMQFMNMNHLFILQGTEDAFRLKKITFKIEIAWIRLD
jgi:hypothetical protein